MRSDRQPVPEPIDVSAYVSFPPFSPKGPFKCYVTLFFLKLDPHPPPRNANNTEHYTFITLFSRKSDPPTALRNTWMAPK